MLLKREMRFKNIEGFTAFCIFAQTTARYLQKMCILGVEFRFNEVADCTKGSFLSSHLAANMKNLVW